ncbi:MAG: hypothetical protein GEV05_03610 [Betaproteobacteria bacterium]|nr:hypothetical protein [Betaproteobacteria bacterium]
MTSRASAGKARILAKARHLRRQFLRCWRTQDATERYLGAATDHADLERRIRDLERMNSGPAFVTFNH